MALIAIAVVLAISCKETNKNVRIHGTLKGFNTSVKMESYDPKERVTGEGILVQTDSMGSFDLTFQLEAPKYFRLGRNHLYLSPGNNIEMHLNKRNPQEAKFEGKGSRACDYLKIKPFPKGGSYLDAGLIFKTTGLNFDKIKSYVEKCSEKSLKRLSAYSGLSSEFIELERKRIVLNTANSYKSLPIYASVRNRGEGQVDYSELEAQCNKEVKKYLDQIEPIPDDLQLEEFGSLINKFMELYGEDKIHQEIKDYATAFGLIRYLSSVGPTRKFLDYKKQHYPKLVTKAYIDLVDSSLEKFKSLLPGNVAPKLNFEDPKGENKTLSDFRGKLLVIDIWATWCGPCIAETPHFEKLNEKYGSKIQFISVSIDENKEKWLNFLKKHKHKVPQFRSMRSNFEAYYLSGVPRFMLIDKEGKFIDAWVAKPSSGELEQLIAKHI